MLENNSVKVITKSQIKLFEEIVETEIEKISIYHNRKRARQEYNLLYDMVEKIDKEEELKLNGTYTLLCTETINLGTSKYTDYCYSFYNLCNVKLIKTTKCFYVFENCRIAKYKVNAIIK